MARSTRSMVLFMKDGLLLGICLMFAAGPAFGGGAG